MTGRASSEKIKRLDYPGNLSHQLLQVLLVEPRQMSSQDLFAYLQFLDENRLDANTERLIFWQKMFSPATIVIMCLLAFPFGDGIAATFQHRAAPVDRNFNWPVLFLSLTRW